MIELFEYKGEKYADARILHSILEIKKDFSTWARNNIDRAYLDNTDFYTFKGKSTGGRPLTEYWLKKDAALAFIMISGGKNAKQVRFEVIKAFQEKQSGILLNVDQVSALTDMVKAMTLISNQVEAESKHYNYLNKPKDWWKYRAELLGYSKETLIEALKQINKRYKNQRQALVNLDPVELIRTGVIDLLIALGRNPEYALNVAEFAKVIAEKNNYHLQIWDDRKPNPLGLNSEWIEMRKKLLK